MSAAGPGLDAADLAALDAILAGLGDWLRGAAPAARGELRACLHRIITWPWPEDMHVAAMACRLALQGGTTIGGNR